MKKLSVKRMLCLTMAAMLLLSSGCGNGGDGTGGESDSSGSTAQKESGDEAGGEAAMGRYLEEEIDLSGDLEVVRGLRRMPDLRLVIEDTYQNFQVSEDQGVSWKAESNPWLEKKRNSTYFLDAKMAPDGTLAVIYDDYPEGEGENQGEEDEEDVPEGDASEEDSAGDAALDEEIETASGSAESLGAGEEETEESMFQLSPECALIRPDGTEVPVEYSMTEEELYPTHFWISDSGRFFMTSYGENIYEVMEDGRSELFLTLEGSPQLVQFAGDLMILDGYDFQAPLLYDMEKKEYVVDQAFADFVEENYADRQFNGGSWYDLFLFSGEEETLYLAGKKGLHRHVIGQEETQQLIDGAISRLGSPKYGLVGMVMLETEEFLALFSGGKLIRFTFDPDVAAVPSERLKVYSLTESYDVRVAATAYQVQNPDVFVEYETGMEEGGAVTREDALKKLNTEIMAGQGPDVLMLDGLPVDSYVEKGLLDDLSGLVDELGDELFGNLIRAMEREGGIYGIPTQVQFPILLGKEEYISGMKDLSSIADGIEKLRRDNPGKDLLGTCSEKGIMKVFSPVSAPAWKGQDGEMDTEALSEFLTQMKRIYEAQTDGLGEKEIERYLSDSEYNAREYGEDWLYDLSFYGGMSLDYIGGNLQLLTGTNSYPYGYFEMTSVHKAKGFEDARLIRMEGQSSNVFIPQTILGINAASGKKELARDFLKLFLGEENQEALGGFGVNRKAVDQLFKPEEKYLGENGEYGSIAMSDGEGLEVYMEVYVSTQEELAVFYDWMESAVTPYIADLVLEKAVFEEGSKYILGEGSLEEALDAIEQRLAIYMAE